MTDFNFNLLTINGITKICDDNIYIYDKEVINYQWHYFQLEYILRKIKKKNIDSISGLKLTKEQMCKLIKEYLQSNQIIFNSEEDTNYGFIPKYKLNEFSSDNLGGIPNKNLKSNKYGTKISVKPNKYLFGTDAEEFEKNIQHDKLKQQRKSKRKKFNLFRKKQTYSKTWVDANSIRKDKALIEIPKWSGDQMFLNYGRLDWKNNSCWADSVLVMIFFKIFENTTPEDIIHPLFTNYILEDIRSKQSIGNSKEEDNYNCFKPNDFDSSYPILRDINKNFQELYHKLNQKEIFRVNKLIYSINQCPSKKGVENWIDGSFHDALDFFKIIFKIFNIPSEEYNIKQTLKLNTRDVTYMDSVESIFKNDFVTTDEVSGEPVSDSHITQDNSDTNIITKDITPSDLKKLEQVSTDGCAISWFLDNKFEQDVELYDVVPGANIINENHRRFIEHKEEKIDITTNIYDGPLATYIPKIINRFIINNTNHIFFGIHRLQLNTNVGGKNAGTTFNNLNIIPDRIIHLTGPGNKKLLLRSIIVWYNSHYVTFFQKKDTWYLYNDIYDTTKHNDYVITIGDYKALISYNLVDNVTVLTNSVLLWYCI
jgi:hypothetical protein